MRQADRHIATVSRNVAKQFAVVQALEVKGLDVGLALNLLEVMREMLSEFQRHRRLIVDAIKDSRQDG